MTESLRKFRQSAVQHGICEMLNDWDKCKSKRQLMDVALSIRGIEYLCHAIVEGWGITPDAIAEDFIYFKDGKFVRNLDGYSSCFYCKPELKKIEIKTTATLIINFNGDIIIPKERPSCEIYLVNSYVKICGEGSGKAYLYNSRISNQDTAQIIVNNE